MAVNAKAFKKFAKSFNLSHAELMQLENACAKELGARLLRGVVKKTPVGIYPPETGKQGGTLRRRWQASAPTNKSGTSSVIVSNPVEYASYVEHGHVQEPGRFVPAIGKRLVASWVPGKHMLRDTENELRPMAQAIVDKKIAKYMEAKINGK